MNPNNLGNSAKNYIIVALVGAVLVIWAALLCAPYSSGGLPEILASLPQITEKPFNIHFNENSARTVAIFLLIYGITLGVYFSTQRHYRRGEEHGSAKMGNAGSFTRKYANKVFNENILLTQNARIGLDGRKHKRNLNVLVVGGSGAGKTRFYCKPNIMQANTSFFILDTKAEMLYATGNLLKEKGYDIKILDFINMDMSYGYNPFSYLRDEKDVLKLVDNLIKNTTPKGASQGDPFWERSETALLEALILYLMNEAPEEEQNFPMVMELLNAAEVREEDEQFASVLDELFERLEEKEPDSLAVKQYHIFKMAAGKTAKSILVSLGVRLEKFNVPQVADIVRFDELNLPSMGEKKTALFALLPDNDQSLNFIIGMLYTQLFQELFYLADRKYGGRLPVHVHCIMDEFANCCRPSNFAQLLSTMRSREISVSIILQNIAQLKALYEKEWESIIGNCDEFLYLGGNEQGSHKYVSELLGKATIDTNTYGKSSGHSGNYSTNYQNTGRELFTPDEVRMLDNRYAILFVRGERAVLDYKYDILKHPDIKRTTDGNAEPYSHGNASFGYSASEIVLKGSEEDYELLIGNEEIENWLNEKNEKKDN